MRLDINMKMSHLLKNQAAYETLENLLPGLASVAAQNEQVQQLSVSQLIRYSNIPNSDAILIQLDEVLMKLNTPENAISPEERIQMERFQQLTRQEQMEAPSEKKHSQDAIYPGTPWLDTNGARIQAHGGAVYYERGNYYWYGENKAYTNGRNGIWTWGIKVYSSTDLYNWQDLGYLIPPVLDDPNSAMFPAKRIDRPHILKCPKTGKYVCWIKLSGPEAAFSVWQADSFLGPYSIVENLYNPGGHKAGDFDLVSDEETGKGYLFFDADHRSMLCMELTEDYLHASREAASSYSDLHPPFTREGPALFRANQTCYLFTSGMTGYVPNRSDSAAADSWEQNFVSLGSPHIDDISDASFNSQISKVFRVENTNLYIAMADRWLPQYPVNARLADIFRRTIASNYDPEHYQATDEERQEMYRGNVLETANTAISDYVWLPVQFKEGKPTLQWYDRWKPEDFL